MQEINPRRVEQQVRNFQRAIHAYNNVGPLARFLTQFFKENKQMGSSDRRMTSRFCYNYFRLGKALQQLVPEERIVVAEFLCEQESALVCLKKVHWEQHMTSSVVEKLAFLKEEGIAIEEDIFPFFEQLSAAITPSDFVVSHLIQPDLFIRAKLNEQRTVEQGLEQAGIAFEHIEKGTYRLPNGSRLQELKNIEGCYEVQDWSSQQSLDKAIVGKGEAWWDACAASGGKSLLLLDQHPTVKLLVSDIRLSILRNLEERFVKANIRQAYRKKILDLTHPVNHLMDGERFDGIILDAPCSGAGTWGRTPEMIQQFSLERLSEFVALQREIVVNVLPYLKTGGQLVYITCSVFKDENEGMLEFLQQEHGLRLEEGGIIAGYQRKSDTMFSARLRKI